MLLLLPLFCPPREGRTVVVDQMVSKGYIVLTIWSIATRILMLGGPDPPRRPR
jgi:hypothetical protein